MASARALVGREEELATIHRLVARAHAGGGSLVIRGAPGVGKSALLETVGEELSGRGWRVLRTDGTPAERRLPFAALHKLLRPIMGQADGLLARQRDALLRAFGLLDGPAPGIFLVALAALDLLAETATAGPVLIVVEDTHWLDRATADVLGFIARRLESDSVLVLASGRDGGGDRLTDSGLPELHLSALDAVASGVLLDASNPELSASRRRIVLEASAGNPLALVELPKALENSHGPADILGEVPMTDRLERAFAVRASELPEAAGDLVLLAAVNDSDSVAEVVGAAAVMRPGASVDDLGVAMSAGLILVDESVVRFRHPLVRSAIYRSASMARRHAAHAALAEILAGEPNRSVWHRAASVVGPDGELAAELEVVALGARRRGAIDTALAALRRSAQLSKGPALRGRRLLGAADLAFELGEVDLGGRLLRTAGALELEARDRVRLEWIRELSDERLIGGAERVEVLIELAEQARAGGDRDLSLQLLRRAALRCWTIDLGPGPAQRVIAATDRTGVKDADPLRVVIQAYASPFERGAEVLALLDQPGVTRGADLAGLHMLAQAAACVGAFARAETLCIAAARGLREQGRLARLAPVLAMQAWAALRLGRWAVASAAAEESARLAQETRQPLRRADALSAQAMLASMRGDVDAAATIATEAEGLALAVGSSMTLALVQNARAMAASVAGRPVDAFEQLFRIYQPADPAHHRMQACWAIGSLAEYAVASAHREQAADELAKLEPLAASTPSTGVQVAMRYARALLADPTGAESRYLAALAPELGGWPFDEARVLLSYGGWLRRQRRVTDARAPLRSALETFERLGVLGWAERARRELRAAGEDSVRRAPEAWYQLTAQETQIAQLVAEGLSNKDIGRQLYLSHRTIASHLYRMFPKLGVTSRAQLARAVSVDGTNATASGN